MIHAVIMAGGKGERFWPLSRSKTPKQLLPIVGKTTMLEQTLERVRPLVPHTRTWVATNEAHARAIRRLLPTVPPDQILAEPVGRNTAPCIALAAYAIAQKDPEAVMVILPADHVISPRAKFIQIIRACCQIASGKDNYLITLGVKPRYPATGYGYIRQGRRVCQRGFCTFYQVKEFTEKPGLKTARRFIHSGDYSWNSGMFVWSARALLEAIAQHLPVIARRLEPIFSLPDRKRAALLRRIYPSLPDISLDYGIMEKHGRVLVTPANFSWDDVGSWEALNNHYVRDINDNVGRGKFLALDSSDCIVASTEPLVVLLGVSDLVVAATGDAVLVSSREKVQEVKKIVQRLRQKKEYLPYV